MAVAVLAALGSHLDMFPWLAPWAEHTIELGSFIATIVIGILIDPKKALEAPTLSELRDRGPAKIGIVVLATVLGAGVLVSSCAGHTKFQQAVIGETAVVQAVDAVVKAEAAAYKAGAYSQAQHQKYDAALLKVVQGEKATNDALTTWSASSGQPMPVAVLNAVKGLQKVSADIQPLAPSNSAVAALAANVSAALSLLLGVQ
jgi:hypothetical protein